ncbi:hypothetical protein M404DRAFT_1007860 [Pisolithus tinctorius Marx 270]|uniref:Uncharacterized protein n=1 Tax=Pisolithus tinctorius Marx 270 TaxID=870435 RepID=A0A0C3NHV4_PISTI|nr:hypothetical protein M404DRAFT_1007860 [Pisolithus tinctorius Marx 270]
MGGGRNHELVALHEVQMAVRLRLRPLPLRCATGGRESIALPAHSLGSRKPLGAP